MIIITFIESSNNKIHPVSLESLVVGQKLKKETEGQLHAVVFDSDLAQELSKYNLDSVVSVDNENLKQYSPLHYLEAFDQINTNLNPGPTTGQQRQQRMEVWRGMR